MIVEFFGPPCVGKTTFACTIATRLRKRGHRVKLTLSYRPSEYPLAFAEGSAQLRAPAVLRRLARPMLEGLAVARQAKNGRVAFPTAEVARLAPTNNIVRSLRLRQYLLRLHRNWLAAEHCADLALFDQAFVQVICSSSQLNATLDTELIGQALDAVPEADLLVRLDAPREVLEARLVERQRRQGRIERLLDRAANSQSLWVYDEVHELLRLRGRSIILVDSSTHASLMDGVDRVEVIVVGRLGVALAAARENGDGAECE